MNINIKVLIRQNGLYNRYLGPKKYSERSIRSYERFICGNNLGRTIQHILLSEEATEAELVHQVFLLFLPAPGYAPRNFLLLAIDNARLKSLLLRLEPRIIQALFNTYRAVRLTIRQGC